MALTDLTIIRRSLTSRLFSTLTTVATVAVAVALLLVLLSMRDAGRRAFDRGSGNAHMVVAAGGMDPLTVVLNTVFYAQPPRNALDLAQQQRLLKEPPPGQPPLEVLLKWAIRTQQGDSYRGLPVLATEPEFFTLFEPTPGEPWRFAQGRAFERPFEVVVGAHAAREAALAPGDTIFLTHGVPGPRNQNQPAPHEHREYQYTIVGVLEPTGSAHDRALFTDLPSSWVLHAHDRRKRDNPGVSLTTVDDITDADRLVTAIYLHVVTPASIPVAFNRLRMNPAVTVAQPKQEIDKLFRIVGSIDQILLAMAGAVLVSSGIAIMLALYNSMEQRRRQIAVLRVLGCSRPRVFGLILTESAILGALGAAAGLALSLAGTALVSDVMRTRLGLFIDPVYEPRWTLGVGLGATLLAALAGLVPGVMAYRTSVAKNLRPMG